MGLCLNRLGTTVTWSVLQKQNRTFALLGKATAAGLVPFGRNDVSRGWALTAELGRLRLERLSGDEELTGDQLVLPTAFSYDYGITGAYESAEMTRAIYGLLPAELEQLVTALRRGSFPLLGFSHRDLRCSISGCVIPGFWPHVVVSNSPLYGNVVSVESFIRLIVSSLPQNHMSPRMMGLQPMFRHLMKMATAPHHGVPYTLEMLDFAPVATLAAK